MYPIPWIIAKKRNGETLTEEELRYFVESLTRHAIEDVQTGAMLMAIYFNGLTDNETYILTKAMLESGSVFNWPEEIKPLIVDKHSTGGVGDKISLILAPALAACGLKVPMISGRGLGFTGGTIDKLEAIPGFRSVLSADEAAIAIQQTPGFFIMAQSNDIVPADKILYAFRDISATVDSIPLIAASILSKKAAEDLSCLLLDLKCGPAAFMKDMEKAKELADVLVSVGNKLGIRTAVMITRMDTPVGRTIGHVLEVEEAVALLKGGGPPDAAELVGKQGAVLLQLAGMADDLQAGELLIQKALNNGKALQKFQEMLISQDVSLAVATELCSGEVHSVLSYTKHCTTLCYTGVPGYLQRIDGRELAYVIGELGAARKTASGSIDLAVGVEILVGVADFLDHGQPWIKVHHQAPQLSQIHVNRIQQSVVVDTAPPPALSQILELISCTSKA